MLTLTGGSVVDADGGREADVAVENGRITAVGEVGNADGEIDVSGQYVAPGLIDTHTHLGLDASADTSHLESASLPTRAYMATEHLRRAVRGGVTTVRDLGAPGTLAIDARDAVRDGTVQGPRVVASGRHLTMTGGHGHQIGGREVDGVADARRGAREQLKAGADLVKCMATGGVLTEGANTGAPALLRDELEAIVDVAEAKGVHTAAHAHGKAGIENATRAGITSIEHGTFIDEETAHLMADHGTYWVPTTNALVGIVEHGVEAGIPEFAVEKAEAAVEAHGRAFDHALEAGVPIAMGTDAGTPFNYHDDGPTEIELMVERGLSPEHALRTATANAADLIGRDDLGYVREDYLADLLVLDADPRADVTAWQDPALVVADGEVVRSDETPA
jgi:imidazolonepropionase-like amidohydrolase